jgi:hypothetical protein
MLKGSPIDLRQLEPDPARPLPNLHWYLAFETCTRFALIAVLWPLISSASWGIGPGHVVAAFCVD